MDEPVEEQQRRRKENIAVTLRALEEDYNKCYSLIRKTYGYLEKLSLREFNKYSKYKWSLDKDKDRGYSYVCVRFGASLVKKSLIKRSGSLSEEELYQWIENKDMVLESLEEAYKFIDDKLDVLKLKMDEMKEQVEKYEQRLEGIGEAYDTIQKVVAKELKPSGGS